MKSSKSKSKISVTTKIFFKASSCDISNNIHKLRGYEGLLRSPSLGGKKRRKRAGVIVAGRFYQDASSVRSVQPNGNGSERSEPITNERVNSVLSNMGISCDAEPVDGNENRSIPIARNVRNAVKQLLAGKPKGAIGENSIFVRSKLIFLCLKIAVYDVKNRDIF